MKPRRINLGFAGIISQPPHNERLADPVFSVRGILKKFNVKAYYPQLIDQLPGLELFERDALLAILWSKGLRASFRVSRQMRHKSLLPVSWRKAAKVFVQCLLDKRDAGQIPSSCC
jgi:hypothetical protein